MDPFHVVRLAGDALDRCRRRVQQTLHGHRGRAIDPLYLARRTLHTGADLLTDRQKTRLGALFATDDHVEVEATWGVMDSFFALLQKNVLDRRSWTTREQLRIAIVTWIERTCHRRRRQARLSRLTPIEFETIVSTTVALAA